MQRIGESKWRPLEPCYWPEQGKLTAKGKEYPDLGYKQLRDKPPKTHPAVAHYEGLKALPPVGKEYHQGYKRVNDRLPKARHRLHRTAEYGALMDGPATMHRP
ncbi:hypothetical protein QJQ45_003128 [Haematococcus lacustris]|nr:hypothetical protein QJQ45_003128 [Haematococcus lacustris]